MELDRSTQNALVAAAMTERQAVAIYEQGREAVVFALLELTKRLAEAQGKVNPSTTPSTPSGMIPTYQKPTIKPRGKKRPGAKHGHPGSRRETPQRIDWRAKHRADNCPDCGGRLKRCEETRVRYIEDIPDIQPEVTEHTIHRDWWCELQEEGRAARRRRVAGKHAGQPRVGAQRVAALRPRQHARPDRGSLQLSSANEDQSRRPGRYVVSVAGDSVRVVRRNSTASARIGRVARRRDAPGA